MAQAHCYLLGERTVVLELPPPFSLDAQRRIWGLVQRLQHCPEVAGIVPGMNNLSVMLRDPQQQAASAVDWLQQQWQQQRQIAELATRQIDIPVIYGGIHGPDLDEVAQHSGMSAAQVVACHCSVEYVVCFIGFQPGFPYLAGLDRRLHTPRRAEPRLRVPAGSVGIGGSQTGIYPLASPGGWLLIGYTPTAIFTPDQQPPVLLHPGDRLRFVPQREGVC